MVCVHLLPRSQFKLASAITTFGLNLISATVDKINGDIRGYNHDDETRKSILSAAGLPDDANAPKDAVNLNNLDDWTEFHNAVLK